MSIRAGFPTYFCAFAIKSVIRTRLKCWSGWLDYVKTKDGWRDRSCLNTSTKKKTACISKFEIIPYISEQIVADANKDAFVLMFEESLNQTTKKKHLDVHVRY